jgi:tetratricopeptide (TPR) repeat protein
VLLAELTATHGSSGGPVFDGNGKLIGLISGGLTDIKFTIVNTINNAFPLLNQHLSPPATQVGGPEEDLLIPAAGVTESELRAVQAYNRGVAATTPAEKVDAYRRAITLLPEFYEACFNLAVAEYRAGAVEEAVQTYQRAARLRPQAAEVKRNLGRIYLKTKQHDKAIEVFRAARDIAPNAAQSYNDLGEAYRRAGNYAAAIDAFLTCLKLQPDAPRVHFNLALAYADNGQATEAIQHFESYLRLAPEAPDSEQVRAVIKTLRSS